MMVSCSSVLCVVVTVYVYGRCVLLFTTVFHVYSCCSLQYNISFSCTIFQSACNACYLGVEQAIVLFVAYLPGLLYIEMNTFLLFKTVINILVILFVLHYAVLSMSWFFFVHNFL